MNAADELIGAFDQGADSDELQGKKGKKKEKKEDKKKQKKGGEEDKVEEEKKEGVEEKVEEEEIVPEYPKNVTYCHSKFFFGLIYFCQNVGYHLNIAHLC